MEPTTSLKHLPKGQRDLAILKILGRGWPVNSHAIKPRAVSGILRCEADKGIDLDCLGYLIDRHWLSTTPMERDGYGERNPLDPSLILTEKGLWVWVQGELQERRKADEWLAKISAVIAPDAMNEPEVVLKRAMRIAAEQKKETDHE